MCVCVFVGCKNGRRFCFRPQSADPEFLINGERERQVTVYFRIHRNMSKGGDGKRRDVEIKDWYNLYLSIKHGQTKDFTRSTMLANP